VDIVTLKMVKESSILYPQRSVKSPEDAYELVKQFLIDSDREIFLVVNLSTKNTPNSINVCHVGSLNSSIVHPREVMKAAILSNSASILIAHNHPSSDVTPSKEDIKVTKRLIKAGEILGIELLDHLIVGGGNYLSMKEKGYL
jgi:DNA repair protein RadC